MVLSSIYLSVILLQQVETGIKLTFENLIPTTDLFVPSSIIDQLPPSAL